MVAGPVCHYYYEKKCKPEIFFRAPLLIFFPGPPFSILFPRFPEYGCGPRLLIYNIFVMFTIIIINRFKRLRSFYSELVALTSFLIEVENLQTQVFWELCFLFFFPCPGFQYFSCDRFNMGSAFDLFFPRPQFSILFSAISGIWLRAPYVTTTMKKFANPRFFSGSAFDFFSRAPVFNTFSTISGIWLRAPIVDLYLCYVYFFGFSSFLS